MTGTHLFFAVQGGSTHILVAFRMLAILHPHGAEFPHADWLRPYKYLSNNPPELLIARNDAELDNAIRMFASANVVDDKFVIDTSEFANSIVGFGYGSE